MAETPNETTAETTAGAASPGKSAAPILEVRDLKKTYHDGQRELKVLRSIELEAREGEAVAVVGMSGSGKSTLLHLLGALDRPDEGQIVFRGDNLTAWSRARLDAYRNRHIGFIFQFHHLLPEFNALENVMMPALVARQSKAQAEAKARDLLGLVGLEDRLKHRPGKLSGGEQQRVSLARALINEPDLVLADEPTGNLDANTAKKVIELMWKVTAGSNRGLIIVTHEMAIAERADRIYLLKNGRLAPLAHADLASHMDFG